MDESSFTGSQNIVTSFKSLLNLNLPLDERIKLELDKICQIRHCSVHRFGKLGAKNAMKLGISSHSSYLEKPVSLSYENLQNIAQILRTIVKHINNQAYKTVIQRTSPKYAKDKKIQCIWTTNYLDDKHQFKKYYNVFATKNESTKTPQPNIMYKRMFAHFDSETS
ncbi:hypothetical protein JEU11_15740 [Paraglaciecola chathamensis]|uniref:Uncharacterized protein n=1 Tax=Paraglaciecola chathamensis TaxID=368405 RepID=A0ABS0WHJ4_9ALTE|nr:hypothetical protein [Paraglaciecola chathamensis]MBJ2137913.1 hypothetical protein [Paraglaciecola chathamensis]